MVDISRPWLIVSGISFSKWRIENYRTQGKRVPYDILNNLSSVDLFYEKKAKTKILKKNLGIYQGERQGNRTQMYVKLYFTKHIHSGVIQPRSFEWTYH